MKSSGNISLSCAREGSGIIVALIFFDVSQRRASSRGETASRFLPLPAFRIHQKAKVSMLIETTLKQLGVLSEMLWLMSKPNKRSKRLKANIVAWTSSAVSVNLSLSELRPDQIQIWDQYMSVDTDMSTDVPVCAHMHAEMRYTQVWCSCVALEWCPGGCGEAERGLSSSAAPLFTLMVSRC